MMRDCAKILLKVHNYGMSNSILNQHFARRLLKDRYTEKSAQFLSSLMQANREGHLCIESNDCELPEELLDVEPSDVPNRPLVKDGNRYYLQRNWVLETYILKEIRRLLGGNLSSCEPGAGLDPLLPTQKKAVLNALKNSFSIICGGPGTGKTYTAAALVRSFLAHYPEAKVMVAAPTGKAASHFSSVLGAKVEATTLHRLLRVVKGDYKLFSGWKIDADLVLVDEASMIDVPMLAKLLESIGSRTRLVLMGDPDQLPPVEAGGLFKELSELFGTRLEKSMRTDNALIQSVADHINRGEWSDEMPLLSWNFDASFKDQLYKKIDPLFFDEMPDIEGCFQALNRFRVLGALRQGPFGTDALNRFIVEEMGRLIRPGQWWTIPIMVTSNHPDRDLYNGSCGILVGKSRKGIFLNDSIAYFPEKIPFKMLPSFEIAFCLSIHKSQGSEFEKVLALFPEGSENFGKEAIYTAVTRAKKEIEIVGRESTLRPMLLKQSAKSSGLTHRFSIATNPLSGL